jgi:hypothetical protein
MPPTKAELAFIRDATGALDEDINAAFAAKNNDVNETVEFLISSTLSFFLLLSLLQLNNTPPPPPAKRGPLGARLLLFPPRRRASPGTMLSRPALSVSARRQRLGPRRRAARQKRLPFGAPSPLLSLSCSPPLSSSLCLRFANRPHPHRPLPNGREEEGEAQDGAYEASSTGARGSGESAQAPRRAGIWRGAPPPLLPLSLASLQRSPQQSRALSAPSARALGARAGARFRTSS